ncbi:tetratricopeptide repeat protein [Streptomyces tanashiensis]
MGILWRCLTSQWQRESVPPTRCGSGSLSFALCDRADAVDRVMWTAVARAATWRVRGDLDQAAAAFESALLLDSANGSLCLDLADVRAEQGAFAAAASLVERGLEHEPQEVTLRAASTRCQSGGFPVPGHRIHRALPGARTRSREQRHGQTGARPRRRPAPPRKVRIRPSRAHGTP